MVVATDNIWATDGGVYFGNQVESPADEDQPLAGDWKPTPDQHRYSRDRHLVTVGPSGSGKTRRLLLPNLLQLTHWSILVVDPKGTLAALTAKHRKEKGNDIFVIDPFRVLEKEYPDLVAAEPYLKSCGNNPLAALDPKSEEFEDDVRSLSIALIKDEDKVQPHWAHSARSLVAGLMMAARLEFDKAASLVMLRDYLGADITALSATLKTTTARWESTKPAIKAKLGRFTRIDADNKELQGILSTALTQTEWLDSAPVQRDLDGRPIDFKRMKERPTTVYLILPPLYLESHSTWLRLMIAAILQPLMRSVHTAKVPVLFILDEFAQLGHVEIIENCLALTREYGVKLWPVLQDLGQLIQLYDKRWESFISNAGVLHAFAPRDWTTAEYLSKLSGQHHYWINVSSASRSKSIGPQYSETVSQQEGWQNIQEARLQPEALSRMTDGQAVLFSDGHFHRSWLEYPKAAMRGT